ncbi:MAG: uncharacterized protein KVP18_003632 [Porospora cf. gigantea A]|uniref:uncharacterized protein n=1 Tax=Porospora cf. gigantea A TaxID=2853593 RepID=UPI0035595933|nr:MAG: hypothetical protein KVP18_003632 [Porospora cf. gigantea A]
MQPEVVYADVDADTGVSVVESLCTQCGENGVTRLMLTKIPYFREVILSSFECPHCGFRNTDIQTGAELEPQGCVIRLTVSGTVDLDRQIIKSEFATFRIPSIQFEIPAKSEGGRSSTVEGLITQAATNLAVGQIHREGDVRLKIQEVISRMNAMASGEETGFIVELDDPAGHSHIESLTPPKPDSQMQISHYDRTTGQMQFMGFYGEQKVEECHEGPDRAVEEKVGGDIPEHLRAKQVLNLNESVGNTGEVAAIDFSSPCSHCGSDGRERMCEVDVPGFRKCMLMAYTCDNCGFKSNDLKAGGTYGEQGRVWTLNVVEPADLGRDVLKADTARVEVPELEFVMCMGTQGGIFTTIEGLLMQTADHLEKSFPFHGDSSEGYKRKAMYENTIAGLRSLAQDESRLPFTLVLDDCADLSFIGHRDPTLKISDIEKSVADDHLTTTFYTRSDEQNDDLGILDMKVDDY